VQGWRQRRRRRRRRRRFSLLAAKHNGPVCRNHCVKTGALDMIMVIF
jgi:hypothetical protein